MRAGLDAFDLVVTARAVLGGEEPPLAVPREAWRIARAERPHRRAGNRIVGGPRAVRFQPQDFPVEAVPRLGQPRLARVAHRRVELAVGTELQPAAVVRGRAVHAVEEHALLARAPLAQRESGDAVDETPLPLGGVANGQVAGVGEAWIERQAHEAGLTLRGHGHRRDGGRLWPPLRHGTDAAAT